MALNSEISTDDLKKIMESIKTTPAAYVDDVAWLADAKKRFNALPDGEERKNALLLYDAAKEAHDAKKKAVA